MRAPSRGAGDQNGDHLVLPATAGEWCDRAVVHPACRNVGGGGVGGHWFLEWLGGLWCEVVLAGDVPRGGGDPRLAERTDTEESWPRH